MQLPKARERVLDTGELRAIWQVTAAGEFPFDPFVRLLILLGCRRGELAGMRRDELDLAAGLWQLSRRPDQERAAAHDPATQAGGRYPRLAAGISRPVVFSTVSGTRPISGFMKFKQRLDRRLGAAVSATGPCTISGEPCGRICRRCRSAAPSPS